MRGQELHGLNNNIFNTMENKVKSGTEEVMHKGRKLTYSQALLLRQVIIQRGYSTSSGPVKAELSRLSNRLDKVVTTFSRERNYIFLYHGGIESSDNLPKGASPQIIYPPFPVREETKGDDETFKKSLFKNKEIREKIDKDIDDLMNRDCGMKITRILYEEEFDKMGEGAPVTWIDLKEHLVVDDKLNGLTKHVIEEKDEK